MLVDSPVQVQQPTAPQIIKQNVETVQGNTAQDTVSSIMAKLNMNN